MMDEADNFSNGFIEQPYYMYPNKTDVYYARGPHRTVEHSEVIADRKINKHQEKITHNDTCQCKQYEYDDLVVMYEHIEQYPQYRCYCKWCIGKLNADIKVFGEYTEATINLGFRVLLGEEIVKKHPEFKLK